MFLAGGVLLSVCVEILPMSRNFNHVKPANVSMDELCEMMEECYRTCRCLQYVLLPGVFFLVSHHPGVSSLTLFVIDHSRSARVDFGQRRFYARGRVYFGIPVGRTSCCGVGACFSHEHSHIINVLFIIDQLWTRFSLFNSVACELWDCVLFCFSCIGFWYPICPMVICSVALRHSG